MARKLDVAQKKKIGDRIKHCLFQNDLKNRTDPDKDLIISAQDLANRIGVTPTTIYKMHSGEFSMKTLQMVETVLKISFFDEKPSYLENKQVVEEGGKPVGALSPEDWVGAMPARFGGYSQESIDPYLGSWMAFSRGVSISSNFLGSHFDIYWDQSLGAARFKENKRFTASDGRTHDYSQSGTLHMSAAIKNLHLLTAAKGAIRLITLTGLQRDPDPVMYGALLTQVPESGQYIPAKSTIFFRQINDENRVFLEPLVGPINPEHDAYEKISADLDMADKAIYTR